jgi:UDP-3-O-[3-hydroxymyristoyl] glucosamine N-acyltransferase
MKLHELAERLGAILTGGDGQAETAGAGEVTFVANPKYASLARSTRAAAVLVEPSFAETPVPTLRVENPYLAFARAIECFYQPPRYAPGIHPTAVIAPTARMGARAHVGAYVVVSDDVAIGDDAVLLSHVVIYPGATIGERFFAHAHAVVREHCRLGDDVILQNGAIIGADGFGFAKGPGGRWIKIVQSGSTVLEDAVEVQANACIDRASIGETRIGAGAKVDNLVQVGHGSAVGENTLLCAQVGLAGSTTIGKDVILAGQVGVAGHLTVGDGAIATAQTGIPSDVAPGAVVSGYPAMDNRAWLRTVAAVNRLPDLLRKLRGMEK